MSRKSKFINKVCEVSHAMVRDNGKRTTLRPYILVTDIVRNGEITNVKYISIDGQELSWNMHKSEIYSKYKFEIVELNGFVERNFIEKIFRRNNG